MRDPDLTRTSEGLRAHVLGLPGYHRVRWLDSVGVDYGGCILINVFWGPSGGCGEIIESHLTVTLLRKTGWGELPVLT